MKAFILALLSGTFFTAKPQPAKRQLASQRQTAIARAVAKRERRKQRNLENRT